MGSTRARRLRSSGTDRRFLLHEPATRTADAFIPLVLAFHGFTETPGHLRRMSAFDALADREGFLVAYPQGTGFPLRWAAHEDPAESAASARDVAFVADLLDHLQVRYAIDTSRVFACGFSNGGGMALLAGRALTGRIAAIAGVGGAYTCPWEVGGQPLPLLAIHGLADPIVPFEGSARTASGFALPQVADWAAEYARRNGCGEPDTVEAGPVLTRAFSGGRRGDVTLITIAGAGHVWPGGRPMPRWVVGHTPSTPDATALIWDFFRTHPA